MATENQNRGYSSDRYSSRSQEYFDNERQKSTAFWGEQEQRRARSEQMKAEQGKRMQELKNRQAQASSARGGLRQMPPLSPANRLGGGKNIGAQRLADVGSDRARGGEAPPPQKLGGVLFWMAGGLAIINDLVVGPAVDAIIAAGMGIAGGGGALSILTLGLSNILTLPLGYSLVALAWTAGVLFLVTVWLIMFVYFYLHGGIHATVKIWRFVIWFFGIACELAPFLNLLPMTTVMFFLVAFMENAVRKNNLIGFAARTAVDARSKRVHPGVTPKINYEIA